MGRKKKTVEEIVQRQPDDVYKGKAYFYGDTYICPACEKPFVFSQEHMYLAGGGHVCSWKCFLDLMKRFPPQPAVKKGKRMSEPLKLNLKGSSDEVSPEEKKEEVIEAVLETAPENKEVIEEIEELW